MKSVLRWCVVPLLAGMLVAQTAAKPRTKKAAAKPAQPAVTLQDIQSLKDALAAQQQQIEQLKEAVNRKTRPGSRHSSSYSRPRPLPATRRAGPRPRKAPPIARKTRSASWTATWPT